MDAGYSMRESRIEDTKSMLISIAAVLFIAYCGLALYLYFMQPTFLYGPMREVPYTPGELGLDFESVVVKSSDGLLLSGWYIPARKPGHVTRVTK